MSYPYSSSCNILMFKTVSVNIGSDKNRSELVIKKLSNVSDTPLSIVVDNDAGRIDIEVILKNKINIEMLSYINIQSLYIASYESLFELKEKIASILNDELKRNEDQNILSLRWLVFNLITASNSQGLKSKIRHDSLESKKNMEINIKLNSFYFSEIKSKLEGEVISDIENDEAVYTENEPRHQLPYLTSNVSMNVLSVRSGKNRTVFIDKKTDFGFKVVNPNANGGADPKAYFDPKHDKRINAILKSKLFYSGIYKSLAKFDTHVFKFDDNVVSPGREEELSIFKLFPNAQPVSDDDLIPLSALQEIEKTGHLMFDVKLNNFVKIPSNKECTQFHFIPIDGKNILKFGSDSLRSKRIAEYIKTDGVYFHGYKFIDMTK